MSLLTALNVGERHLVDDIALSYCASEEGYFGDDCAVTKLSSDLCLLLSTDAGPRRSLLRSLGVGGMYDEGYFAATMSLSDIAAMGGEVISVVAATMLPRSFQVSDFKELLEGFRCACNEAGGAFVGGDTKEADELRVVSTALGICRGYAPIPRSGAQAGDLVFVSSASGRVLSSLLTAAIEKRAGRNHGSLSMPKAAVQESRSLAERGILKSCSDMSDGPLRSAQEIAEASRVTIFLDVTKIPICPSPPQITDHIEWHKLVLETGGGDFGLLATAAEDHCSLLEDEGWSRCGYVQSYKKYDKFTCIYGNSGQIKPWEHFSTTNSILDRILKLIP